MSLLRTGVGHSWWGVQFYQENDGISWGRTASIDDLFTGDCTIECWFLIPTSVASAVYILSKRNNGALTNGWDLIAQATGALAIRVQFAVADIQLFPGVGARDGRWHHAAIDFDVGTLTARLFLDGALLGTDTAVGAYQSDAAYDCISNGLSAVGISDVTMTVGPIRLSSSRRYTGASFARPQPPNWPTNDASAQLITRMNDGSGANVTDYSGNGNNGTITFGATTRWYNDPNVRL